MPKEAVQCSSGFVFIRRETERRLLMLTPRDPYNSALQSFDPFYRIRQSDPSPF